MRLLILVILALVAINFSDGMKDGNSKPWTSWGPDDLGRGKRSALNYNMTYSKFNETRGGPDDSGRGKRSANFNQTRGGGPDDSGRG